MVDKKSIDEFLTRRVESVVGEKELRKALSSDRQLVIKYGVDVTAPFLHIGHAVNLWMMRQLQEWGHKVVFLIGGFTTRIGDPTGKDETRTEISLSDIKNNSREFIKQVSKILLTNPKVFEVRDNSEWYDAMSVDDFLKLVSHTTHAQLIERDMFQKRIKEKKEIRMHEMLYPILQGYDSYELNSNLTIVGNDQLFNELMGRTYQTIFGQEPQAIITTKITAGLDGKQKQSKSLGNYIAITDNPDDQYGKIMSLPDELIYSYFTVYTNVPQTDLVSIQRELKAKDTNPRDIKMRLAYEITKLYHGEKEAKKAEIGFVNVFQKKSTPTNIPEIQLKKPTLLVDLLVEHDAVTSKSEARRLIEQRGVRIDHQVVTDTNHLVENIPGTIIQAGKRKFIQLT